MSKRKYRSLIFVKEATERAFPLERVVAKVYRFFDPRAVFPENAEGSVPRRVQMLRVVCWKHYSQVSNGRAPILLSCTLLYPSGTAQEPHRNRSETTLGPRHVS
ncbi:hypothetical protein DPEC_G00047360 [Dallia pectoralis]|uniref:Uncharacterized protein n=1 Tax=Dallia pectoralis TaxID=75939 RepID=A0ACC2HA36_DALPE|nr:hypothetical protein DPEC_G00047360 [Dallia pectoralis]